MSLNLNLNLSAYKAANRLNGHYSNLNRNIQRLSSGKKLNSSEDSPVDMATHNVHNGRIATIHKGRQNLEDAICLVKTAESAMARIDEILIQMKAIAQQAANGIHTPEQRMILHSEVSQLAMEIDRIVEYTEFKGRKLLKGDLSYRNNIERMGDFYHTNNLRFDPADLDPSQNGLKIHFGPRNSRFEDYYFIRIGDLSMDGLFKEVGDPEVPSYDKVAMNSQHAAQVSLEYIDSAMLKKESNRYLMGIMQNRLENTLQFMDEEILHLTATNSVLADTNIPDEMALFSVNTLLAEAATAMSAQANILPKIALKLLNM